MRGQRRTQEEKNELFSTLEEYLKMGFSLKKACVLTDLPYSTIRDIVSSYEPLRAKTTALQNKVNVIARENIIKSIKDGNIKDSKWWLEKFDHLEPQDSPEFGGFNEGVITYYEYKKEKDIEEEKNLEINNFLEEFSGSEVLGLQEV
jgi:hypothetical protein